MAKILLHKLRGQFWGKSSNVLSIERHLNLQMTLFFEILFKVTINQFKIAVSNT